MELYELEALYGSRVEPSWIDYNGHMNVAYYHLAFDRATDSFLRRIGLGEEYVEREKGSMFALEDHLVYLKELRQGEPFRVTLQLLDFDEKRLHYFLRMLHGEKGFLSATCEHLSIFVDMRKRRSAPMPSQVRDELTRLSTLHRNLPRPEEAGRPMGIATKGT
jgi:acyl-CoA thioester hydrolase